MGIFLPKRFTITAATNERYATITTDSDHGYESGWFVGVWVPDSYGFRIPFITLAKIRSVPSDDTLVLDLDSRQLDTFTVPSTIPRQVAQIVPISGLFTDTET